MSHVYKPSRATGFMFLKSPSKRTDGQDVSTHSNHFRIYMTTQIDNCWSYIVTRVQAFKNDIFFLYSSGGSNLFPVCIPSLLVPNVIRATCHTLTSQQARFFMERIKFSLGVYFISTGPDNLFEYVSFFFFSFSRLVQIIYSCISHALPATADALNFIPSRNPQSEKGRAQSLAKKRKPNNTGLGIRVCVRRWFPNIFRLLPNLTCHIKRVTLLTKLSI